VFSALCSVKKLNKRKQIFFVDLELKKKLISAIFSGTVVINTSPQETISTIQVDNTSSSNAPPSYELVQQNRVDFFQSEPNKFIFFRICRSPQVTTQDVGVT
jgi:hypothetical protein